MTKYIVIVAVALVALMPATAKADGCGLINILFGGDCVAQLNAGITERTDIRNERMIEAERIEAQRDVDIANIEAQAAERVKEAEAEVERVRQLQYQSETERAIAIAQAEARRDEYKAMIAGLTEQHIAEVTAASSQQLAALQYAADIHIAGITETGTTERWRIAGGWIGFVVSIVTIGLVVIAVSRIVASRRQPLMLDTPHWTPVAQIDKRGELTNGVERTNEIIYTRRQ